MNNIEYVSTDVLYQEALVEARSMTVEEIKETLKDKRAYHKWSNDAYEKVLEEKEVLNA